MLSKTINYFKGVIAELKKVEWPTKDQVIKHTYVVITLSLVLVVFLAIIDYGLTEGLRILLNL